MEKGVKIEALKELELLNVDAETISQEDMRAYPMVQLMKNGEDLYVVPNMGIKKEHDDAIYYDVTYAPAEFKTAHQDVIEEVRVKEKEATKSFLKNLVDKIQTQPRDAAVISVIDCAAPVLKSLNSKEISKVAAKTCRFIYTEDGLKKEEIISVKGPLNNGEQRYYDVTDISVHDDLELWAKISGETVELVKKENGLYDTTNSMEDEKKI